MVMGNAFLYRCLKCNHETELLMGIGFVEPNPISICTDIMNGLYGEKAKKYVDENPNNRIDASLEIYKCKCGHVQNEYHITIRVFGMKTYYNRQTCKKCGSIMKMLMQPPENILCQKCGENMILEQESFILWD